MYSNVFFSENWRKY